MISRETKITIHHLPVNIKQNKTMELASNISSCLVCALLTPISPGIVKKKRSKQMITAFVTNVFLGPFRNPCQSKNKPVIGLQLVVMWFIPLVRCPRGINRVPFSPITYATHCLAWLSYGKRLWLRQ